MNIFNLILTRNEIALRIVFSIIVGGVIGYDRGSNNRPAGFRTHILVCLGATIVSLIQDEIRVNSLNFIIAYPQLANSVRSDLGRIGAQVISGIGFLGAGTIIRDKGSVKGLTTAASIWITGCIGLAIGWGFFFISIFSLIATSTTLILLKKLESLLISHERIITLEIEPSKVKSIIELEKILSDERIIINNIKRNDTKDSVIYTLVLSKKVEKNYITNNFLNKDFIKEVKTIY